MNFLAGSLLVSVSILIGAKIMSAASDRLVGQVSQTRGVLSSAVVAFTGFIALYREALANSSAAADATMNALADDLEASIAPLAKALQDNPLPGEDTIAPPEEPADTVEGGAGNDEIDD